MILQPLNHSTTQPLNRSTAQLALPASASLFLNPYDVRSCENKVDVILKKIIETKKAVIPREKVRRRGREECMGIAHQYLVKGFYFFFR